MFIQPVIDRTMEDVIFAYNNQFSTLDLKGSLNSSDLNRIEHNCEYLNDLLYNEGYGISIATKTDWVMEDIPYLLEEVNRIRSNVTDLAQQYLSATNTIYIPLSQFINYEGVNNIELQLVILDIVLSKMIESYLYCGEVECGEVI